MLNVNIIEYHIYIILSIALKSIILAYKGRVNDLRYNLSWEILTRLTGQIKRYNLHN